MILEVMLLDSRSAQRLGAKTTHITGSFTLRLEEVANLILYDNMILIARFDSYLRQVLPFDSPPNCAPIDDCLAELDSATLNPTSNADNSLPPKKKRPKLSRQKLVIPTHNSSLHKNT